jgi:hypothetical protein
MIRESDNDRRARERRQRWFDENTAWRKRALDLIEEWAKDEFSEPYDDITRRVVQRKFARLEQFLRVFFRDTFEKNPAPFSANNAALLVVLPKRQGLELARQLFGGGPGIAGDLQTEDLAWNMDWFRPKFSRGYVRVGGDRRRRRRRR